MIRWSYLWPRLAVLAAVVLIVALAKNPLLRWVLVHSGQEVTGARVDVASLQTGLTQAELRLTDVQAADPHAPLNNLFSARELAVTVEVVPLLSRKLVIREGHVSGLRFGTPRSRSGELGPGWKPLIDIPWGEIESTVQQTGDAANQAGAGCLESFTRLIQGRIEEELAQLETVRLAQELAARWPAEYQRLLSRVMADKCTVDDLRRLIEQPGNDPMANVERMRQGLAQVEQLRQEMEQVEPELARLRQQAERDRDALAAAGQRDLEQIRQRFNVGNLQPQQLTDYFLGPELAQRVHTVAQWAAWGRAHWPGQKTGGAAGAAAGSGRGVDVAFPVTATTPDFLLKCLNVDGVADVGSEHYTFAGCLAGLSSQPEIYGKPATLQIAVDGPVPMRVEAVVDHTQAVPRERILLDCPGITLPRRMWGQPQQIALSITPGQTYVWLLLDLAGPELHGQLQLRQDGIRLEPVVGPQCGGAALADSLREAAQPIHTVQVVVDLSGTLDKPAWQIRSDLGPQIVLALNSLIQHEVEARRDELLAQATQRAQSEMATFQHLVAAKEQEVLAGTGLSKDQINQLAQTLTRRLPPGLAGPAGALLGSLGLGGAGPAPAGSAPSGGGPLQGIMGQPPAEGSSNSILGRNLPPVPQQWPLR